MNMDKKPRYLYLCKIAGTNPMQLSYRILKVLFFKSSLLIGLKMTMSLLFEKKNK